MLYEKNSKSLMAFTLAVSMILGLAGCQGEKTTIKFIIGETI